MMLDVDVKGGGVEVLAKDGPIELTKLLCLHEIAELDGYETSATD